MSGTRRTEEFNAIETRQFILQNPDGSYPAAGTVMSITDNQGTLAPSQDITIRNLTVTGTPTIVNPPEYQDISAIDIRTDNITTRVLKIIDTNPLSVYDLKANRIKTTDLTTTEILASGTSSLDHITSVDIHTIDISATHSRSQDITATHIVTGTASAADIYAKTLHAMGASYMDHIYILDISAQDIHAIHITTQDISATNATISTSAYIKNVTIPGTSDILRLNAFDISARNITVSTSAYIENATIQNLSMINLNLVGDITFTGTVTAYKGDFRILHIDNLLVVSYSFPVLIADKFTGANVNITEDLTVSGPMNAKDINAQDINATSLTLTGTTTVLDIQATNITATSLSVTDGNTSVQDISATSLTVADGHTSVRDLSATSLSVNGPTRVQDLSATSLYVAGTTNADTLYATTITTAEETVSTHLTINGPSSTAGVLTYNDSSGGILVNGNAASSIVVLQPVIFKQAEEQSDFASTVNALFTSYTSFLGLLDSKYLIIRLSPDITFASTCSMQLIVNGILKAPVLFEAGTLPLDDVLPYDSIIKRLNDVGGTSIHFSADTTTWKVTVDISGSNNKIADVSGMPTSSLQVLRYLGFGPLDISSNPFEIYASNGREYIPTFKDLSDGYRLTGAPLPEMIEYTNELDVPVVYISSYVDPYSLPVRFNNRPTRSNTYMAIQCNGSYKLYPTTYSDVSLNGLAPNTSYPITFNYLDLSNNTTVTETGTTANIPFPTDLSVNSITYNSFRAFWTQPYPGKTYTFFLDLSGRDTVTPYTVSDISNTFTGIYNNTDYDVRIRSHDPAFLDSSSNYSPYVRVHTDPLNAPTDLSANAITTVSFVVSWEYPYSYRPDIRFSINIKGGGIDDTSTTNDLSKLFFGLTRDTPYDITIKAYDPNLTSSSSVDSTLRVRTASVDDLFNLSLTAKSYKSIDVTWINHPYVTNYTYDRYLLDISGGGTVSTYISYNNYLTFTELYDDTVYDIRVLVSKYYTYRYWLGGYLQYGYYPITAFSPPLRVRTDSFKAPIIISANTITTNSFNVAWAHPYSYVPAVRYSLDISGGGIINTYNNITALTYAFAGLTKNTQYDITIVALDLSISGYQYNSGPSTFPVHTYLYDAPTNVSSNAKTYKSFNVSWDYPTLDIPFSIDISANGTVINTFNDISALTYAFTGLSNNTDYDIRVRAYNPAVPGSSNYSYIRVHTDELNAPIDLSSNTITYNSFNASWDNPYPGDTNIRFILNISGGGINVTNIITALTYTFTGLNNNTLYNITVATYDSTSPTNTSVVSTLSNIRTSTPFGITSSESGTPYKMGVPYLSGGDLFGYLIDASSTWIGKSFNHIKIENVHLDVPTDVSRRIVCYGKVYTVSGELVSELNTTPFYTQSYIYNTYERLDDQYVEIFYNKGTNIELSFNETITITKNMLIVITMYSLINATTTVILPTTDLITNPNTDVKSIAYTSIDGRTALFNLSDYDGPISGKRMLSCTFDTT